MYVQNIFKKEKQKEKKKLQFLAIINILIRTHLCAPPTEKLLICIPFLLFILYVDSIYTIILTFILPKIVYQILTLCRFVWMPGGWGGWAQGRVSWSIGTSSLLPQTYSMTLHNNISYWMQIMSTGNTNLEVSSTTVSIGAVHSSSRSTIIYIILLPSLFPITFLPFVIMVILQEISLH